MIAVVITLFLIQMITIFVIVLLYSKLSKFQNIEKRQNELINEMDNAISVYLMEMKEENDRLISELKKPNVVQKAASTRKEGMAQTIKEQPVKEQEMEPRKFVPVKQAASAYQKQKTQQQVEEKDNEALEKAETLSEDNEIQEQNLTFEQQVINHYRNGKSIEEIARMMGRGKTEIELLVKFHA
ncbi:hypothetical protein SSIL_2967 [Solibacillus silvestris StLB046]|uniref:Uncharacterized protein n=1 Tax=Solibacillus silvestris (strain StLB046) TaxID=1002809 RepID=F2F2U2_SOLSS|nr:hypothetical protein [Solibacillus silvestris]BAK17390.1 hypothetical protein SSIL_2967 [Solibacillus silvestris StLB046]